MSYLISVMDGLPVFQPYATPIQTIDESPGVFNVKAAPFLAKGDGVSDDRPAIQYCIDAAEEVHGVVYCPPGDYGLSKNPASSHPINHCLKIDASRMTLLGAGLFVSRLFVLPTQGAVGRVLLINHASEIEVAHLTLDGNKVARGYGTALPPGGEDELINMKQGHTYHVHDVRLINSAADAIDGDGVDHVWVRQVYAKDNNGNGCHLGTADDVIIADSEFINNAHVRLASGGDSGADAAAIDLRDSGTYWSVSNCQLKDNARGVVNEASLRGGISNCTIVGGDYGWYGKAGGVLLTGVWFRGQTKAAMRTDGGALKSRATGCEFEAVKAIHENNGGTLLIS